MLATLQPMKKNANAKPTVQVRIPEALHEDVTLIACAMKLSVPEYVEQQLRLAVARDFDEATRFVKERADAVKRRPAEKKGAPAAR